MNRKMQESWLCDCDDMEIDGVEKCASWYALSDGRNDGGCGYF